MDAVPDITQAHARDVRLWNGAGKRMIPGDKTMENPLGKQTKTAKITKVKNGATHPGVSWSENAVFQRKFKGFHLDMRKISVYNNGACIGYVPFLCA